MEIGGIAAADAAGVAVVLLLVRKCRRARQSWIGFVETGQEVDAKLLKSAKTI